MIDASRPHICFVAPNAWPVLAGDTTIPVVGGAEVQQAYIARGLAARGFRVSMICLDHGQPDKTLIDGITVYKTHIPVSGLPLIRFFHPRLTSIWKALKRVDADIYYQRAAGVITGIVALFAKHHGRRFVYAVAHDLDLEKNRTHELFQRRAGWRDRQFFSLGLKLADEIIVQHNAQVAACQRWHNRTAVTVPSCYDRPTAARADRSGYVLWVSTIRAWKQPELFLELARRLPHLRFRMIGGEGIERSGASLSARIREESATLPNVEFLGFVPHAEIEPHFDGARVVVNTSTKEGFPNTFLQAWSRGIPAVSFVECATADHGQRVLRVARDIGDMASLVNTLMTSDDEWLQAGILARHYVQEQHSVSAAVTVYEGVFARLCSELQSVGHAPHVRAASL